MSDLNQCNFIGRLGDNPQMQTTKTGETMATFSIAVSEKWNDKQGNRQERTEWVNIQAFGKLAEIMGQYLQKGSQVFISGKFQSRKYTDQQGIERIAVSILANQMQMLGSRTDGGQGQQQGYSQAPHPQSGYQQGGQGGYGNAPQGQGYQGQQWGQQAQQGYPQPQNGGYAPPQPPQGQAQRQPAPQQGYQSQQANGYNKGFAHPNEAGYQNDGYGNLVSITPQVDGVADDSMPF